MLKRFLKGFSVSNMVRERVNACRTLIITAFVLSFVLNLICSGYSYSAKKGKFRLVPESILRWPEEGSKYAILVDKSKQKVYVYHKENPFRPYRIYRCSTGENNGPKRRRNDSRTPEGVYFFVNSFVKRELSPIYGDRAFPIDYPNPLDRKEGRDGYGIWFHGLNKPLKPMDTNGCIALENKSINDLAKYIELRRTPIIISETIKMIPYQKLKEETEVIEQIIEGWRSSWESKDINRYISYYSPHFTIRGMDINGWKQYKERLNRKYRSIRVKIGNLGIYRYNDTILAIFYQDYRSPMLSSRGLKRLYFRKNSEKWKIIGEFFHKKKIRKIPVWKPYDLKLKEIERFLQVWKDAWEEKAIKTYISCYDHSFNSKGMDLLAWERYKKELFSRYSKIRVKISNVSYKEQRDGSIIVSFRQVFHGDLYNDLGIKKMVLIKRGNKWKIKKETWEALK